MTNGVLKVFNKASLNQHYFNLSVSVAMPSFDDYAMLTTHSVKSIDQY